MSRFTTFASAAVLVASLAPFAAQARSGDHSTTYPPQHLVQIPGRAAPAEHGRMAENANVPARFTIATGAVEYANSGNHDGFAG